MRQQNNISSLNLCRQIRQRTKWDTIWKFVDKNNRFNGRYDVGDLMEKWYLYLLNYRAFIIVLYYNVQVQINIMQCK